MLPLTSFGPLIPSIRHEQSERLQAELKYKQQTNAVVLNRGSVRQSQGFDRNLKIQKLFSSKKTSGNDHYVDFFLLAFLSYTRKCLSPNAVFASIHN